MVAQIGDSNDNIKNLQVQVSYPKVDATMSDEFTEYTNSICQKTMKLFPRSPYISQMVKLYLELEGDPHILNALRRWDRGGFHLDTIVIQPFVPLKGWRWEGSPTDFMITREGNIKEFRDKHLTPEPYRYKSDFILPYIDKRSIIIGVESYGVLKKVKDNLYLNEIDNILITTDADYQEEKEALYVPEEEIGVRKEQADRLKREIGRIIDILKTVYNTNPIKHILINPSPLKEELEAQYTEIAFH